MFKDRKRWNDICDDYQNKNILNLCELCGPKINENKLFSLLVLPVLP